jgi:hypothetical protein
VFESIVSVDSETELFGPGRMAPPLVCVTWDEGAGPQIVHHSGAVAAVRRLLERAAAGEILLVGQNIAYDMAVFLAHDPSLAKVIFDAYDANAIVDTMLVEMMIDLYRGELRLKFDEDEGTWSKVGYSLDGIAQRRGHAPLDKGEDGWRMRYAELRDFPISEWPDRAIAYALDDARITRAVLIDQLTQAQGLASDLLADAPNQAACAFALHLMTTWGMITDGEAIQALEQTLQATFAEHQAALSAAGLLKPKKSKGIISYARNLKEIQARTLALLGEGTPFTDPTSQHPNGQVSTSADTLRMTGDPALMRVAEYVTTQKLLSTYVGKLWEGTEHPIHPRINSFLDTNRTSMSGPNLQNPPTAPGVRECYIPRPGNVFCSVDFDTAELRSLGQTCLDLFGKSNLASVFIEAARTGIDADPHTDFAADMLGCARSEAHARKAANDKEFSAIRKKAKACMFGFPGGMGPAKFVEAQRKSKPPMFFTEAEAHAYKQKWLQTWPEMVKYFDWAASIADGDGRVKMFVSGIYRGGCRFTQAANTPFQGRTASAAKRAVYEVVKAMYSVTTSPLYGGRLVNFLHDEGFAEFPEAQAPAAGVEMARIMCETAAYYLKDVPVTASPALMRRWQKAAAPVWDAAGNLKVWEPEQKSVT